MLVLVLQDHPVDVGAPQQTLVRVELDALEDVEHLAAHRGDVGAGLGRAEQGQGRAVGAGVPERVVEVVVVRRAGPQPGHGLEQPDLLVVADVGEVPDQRGHDGRMLANEVGVRHGLEQTQGPPPGFLEAAGHELLQVFAAVRE